MDRDVFNLQEISYRGVVAELLKNFWMLLLSAAAVWFGITGVGKWLYTPEYTASATLVVSEKGSSSQYASLSVASSMASVFQQVFQSESLKNIISEKTGENIQASISCQQISETNLLVLQATASNPREAYVFITSALEHYEEVSGYVFTNAGLEIVQEASIPSSPSNHPFLYNRRNVLTLFGAGGMAFIIVMVYLLRFTVKTSASASRQLDGKIRGVIPYESKGFELKKSKKKKSLLLNSPLVSMNYAEAGRRVESRIEHHMKSKGQKVLLVTSVSENEGKSTVAANIALALGEKHNKVLLVDGDFRKPAQYKVFEYKKDKRCSLSKVIQGKYQWEDALIEDKKNNIWELLQFISHSDPSKFMGTSVLSKLIQTLRNEMDYIVIDCPPTAAAMDAEIWMQSVDTVALVVRQDWADVRVVNDTVDMIWQSCGDFAGFVLNAFHENTLHGQSYYEHRPQSIANLQSDRRG